MCTDANCRDPNKRDRTGIHTIPDDVVEDILLYYLSSKHSELRHSRETLRLTCRRWRMLIDCSPCFWSTIHLELEDDHVTSRHTHSIQVSLERSKQAPLLISIRASVKSTETVSAYMDLLTVEVHRWKELSLHLVDFQEEVSWLLERCPFHHAESLHRFCLNIERDVPRSIPRLIYPVVRATALRDIDLSWAMYIPRSLDLPVGHEPWNSVTSLTISSNSEGGACSILRYTPSLIELKIKISTQSEHGFQPLYPTTNPHFTSITPANGNNYPIR